MAAFGTSDESNLDAPHAALLRNCEKSVASKFVDCRLNDIAALAIPTGFADGLLDNELLSLPAIAVWFQGVAKPTKQMVIDFFAVFGLVWNSAPGPALVRDESFVAMRVMVFYSFCLELEATRIAGGSTSADPSDMDTPLDGPSAKTFDGAFLNSNGRPVQPGLLPPPSVCGNIKRQFESGVFTDIALRYVVLFKKSTERWHGTQIVSDVASGKQRVIGKAPTKDVKSLFDAFLRLSAISMGRLYIGGTFHAPIASFPGDSTVGVVKGTRVHYDMASHESYCALLQDIASLLGESNKTEFIYRFGIFSERTINATRAGKSFADAQADTAQQLFAFMRAPGPASPIKPFVPKEVPLGEALGGKRDFEQISKIPGFVPGLRTFGSKQDCPGLVAKDANKKTFCQFFTTNRSCTFGANCKRGHFCDVKLADGSVCLQAHSRQKHVEELGVPQYP